METKDLKVDLSKIPTPSQSGKKPLVLCTECGKQFSSGYNLNRHIRNIHVKKKHSIIICDTCQKTCYSKSGFKAHWSKAHSTKKPRPCNTRCPICKHDFTNNKIIKHFLVDHDIKVEETRLNFKDEESFQTWKKKIENDTGSTFILRYTRLKPVRERKFSCHRSGKFRSISKGIRHLKSQGSKKLDGFCPVSLTVLTTEQGIHVRYVPTHVGHDIESDVCYKRISPGLREEILEKLRQNISKHTILEDIRNSCGEKIQREHFITLKDIDNIASKHNISTNEGKLVYNPNSVHTTIDELQKEANSLILFYKPQGIVNEDHKFLSSQDFVLVVMSLAQAEVLKNYGNEVICVHGTPGVDGDNFNLFSLVILDDLHEAFPCSLLITNRNDADILTFFYKLIKGVVGAVTPKIFMSDMADELYNCWIDVMGPVEQRLYCSWYVSKAWRDHLKNIKNVEKRKYLEQHLKTILYELDETKFVDLLSGTVEEFRTDEYYEDFGTYFVENYAETAKMWAYCYRKNAVINTTNNDIERMHKKIKYLYLKGREVGSLDKSINFLIRFIRNKLFDRLTVLYKKKVSQKLKTLRNRHTQWKTVQVSSENDNYETFLVSSNDKTYRVVHNVSNCNCKMFCSECQSCIHRYLCTCSDNAVEWNMCRHIHAVCQYANDWIITTVELDSLSESETQIEHEIEIDGVNYSFGDDVIICDVLPFEDSSMDVTNGEKSTKEVDSGDQKEENVTDGALKAVFCDILENAKLETERIEFLRVMKNFRQNLSAKKCSSS